MKVISILPSYYFGPEIVVIETSCGHKHLRPKSMVKLDLTDFKCWCESEK